MTILIVDDEKRIQEEISEYLINMKFKVFVASNFSEAKEIFEINTIDLVILDIRLPGQNGFEGLKYIRTNFHRTETIMISGHGNMDSVIEAMRLGAMDYLKKPFSPFDLEMSINRVKKITSLNKSIAEKDKIISKIRRGKSEEVYKNMIGKAPKFLTAIQSARNAANYSETGVLITGESGTGKELFAKLIHYLSIRKESPFVAVNSAAIPENLLESEFFGHVKGSFSGAYKDKKGLFEQADGGSLFLDEIGDMPLNLQSKLLRALEERKVRRVGGDKDIPFNVRIISATNKKQEELLDGKLFRLDLFHRLNVLHINLPSLSDRLEDIPPLINFYIKEFANRENRAVPNVEGNVYKMLQEYPFDGNIRELRNLVERALITSNFKTLKKEHFMLFRSNAIVEIDSLNLEENEDLLVRKALEKCKFNQIKTAKMLGISRQSLQRRMAKFNL